MVPHACLQKVYVKILAGEVRLSALVPRRQDAICLDVEREPCAPIADAPRGQLVDQPPMAALVDAPVGAQGQDVVEVEVEGTSDTSQGVIHHVRRAHPPLNQMSGTLERQTDEGPSSAPAESELDEDDFADDEEDEDEDDADDDDRTS